MKIQRQLDNSSINAAMTQENFNIYSNNTQDHRELFKNSNEATNDPSIAKILNDQLNQRYHPSTVIHTASKPEDRNNLTSVK